MKWVAATSYPQLSELCASIFTQTIKSKPNSVLGLATGSTPIGLYKELIKNFHKGIITFEQIVTYNLDEYIDLEQDSEFSFTSFMYNNFFNHINILPANIHIPYATRESAEKICMQYENSLLEADYLDIQLLGLGKNGHIGFNEPGTTFDSITHMIQLTDSTRQANKIHFSPYEAVPTHAITMGISTIMKAKKIVLLIAGEQKADAYHFLRSKKITEDFPASILHLHPDVTVIYLDEYEKLT